MLNQSAVDALYSATYLEDYLDSVESLPDDLQRQISRLKEMDLVIQSNAMIYTHLYLWQIEDQTSDGNLLNQFIY